MHRVECVPRELSETMEKELYNNCLKSDFKKERLRGKRKNWCLKIVSLCPVAKLSCL